MYKPEEYSYRVFWSEEDQAFIATVVEFPRMSSIEDTQEAALSGMVEQLRFVIGEIEKDGDEVPVPLSKKSYSGSIRLRMPTEVHRRITLEAAEQNISINQLLVSRI